MNHSYSWQTKSKKRVFVSFDYDHDSDLKTLLVGQSKLEDSPFEIADWSVKEELTGNWKEKVRERIKKVGIVAVICGEYTDTATGVSAEVRISQEEEKPYFLLKGRKDKTCKKPKSLSPNQLKSQIVKIVNQWNEENEGLKVVRKLKELTK